MMRLALQMMCAGALVCLLSGCRTSDGRDDAPLEPLPTYEEVQARAEERVGALDRLWARASVGLRFTDEDGDRRREQGEGHFQIVKPRNVALTIGKLGETYLLLGCNDEHFWWIERVEEHVAYVGDQQNARDLAIQRVGVPVLPTDLLELADLNAWPAPGEPGAGVVREIERTDLDPARFFAVEFEDEGRTRIVYLTRLAFEPVGVDLITPSGELAARSQLLGMTQVLNHIEPLKQQRVPTRILVDVPSADSRIELSLGSLEISERRPRSIVFDLDELIKRMSVERVVDLERMERGGAR